MTPDYGVECLYCEGSGCGWRTLVHRIGQWGEAWWPLVRRRGQWEVGLAITQKSYNVSFFVNEVLDYVNLLNLSFVSPCIIVQFK
jgi:hypothetical protein